MGSYKSELWDLAKTVIIGIFMSQNTFIRKYKRRAINDDQEKEQCKFFFLRRNFLKLNQNLIIQKTVRKHRP